MEVRADNEPAMESLVTMVVQARNKIGLRTLSKPSQPYEHATNGAAEQAIQTLRDLGTTLLEQVRTKAGIDLKTSDDLIGWAYSHAGHLRNCFSVVGGSTPFERAFGVKYQGKLAMFGETVYFALSSPPLPDAVIPALSGPETSVPPQLDEAGPDPPSTPSSQQHVEPGGDSLSSDALSSNNSVPSAVPEAAMDTSSPIPKRSQQEPSTNPVEGDVEPPSKHQRLVQTVKVDGDTLYTLDEQWEMDPDGGDEHLQAQWDDTDDEVDWSDLREADGPPDLLEDQLKVVDYMGEDAEVIRLEHMKVLEAVSDLPSGAKLLRARFVHDWRFRDKAWKRRARLVCKELKIWGPNRSDVYAPSTNPAVCRVIPLLFTSKPGWIMKSFDVKDAFLCVPQREELYVELGGKTYQVHYCLPGQQAASAWWGEQLAGDLKASGLSVDIAMVRQESSGATVHVDDGLLGGLPAGVDAVVEVLEKKYKVQVSGVVRKPGDSLRFLKKEFTVTDEGLEITLDPKYIDRVCELLNVVNPKQRRVPCSQDILSRDESDPL